MAARSGVSVLGSGVAGSAADGGTDVAGDRVEDGGNEVAGGRLEDRDEDRVGGEVMFGDAGAVAFIADADCPGVFVAWLPRTMSMKTADHTIVADASARAERPRVTTERPSD
jgi:hypothetical protein